MRLAPPAQAASPWDGPAVKLRELCRGEETTQRLHPYGLLLTLGPLYAAERKVSEAPLPLELSERSELFERGALPKPGVRAPPQGASTGVAFSLVTFFWRSKRKLLGRRDELPTKAPKAESKELVT